MPRAKISDAYGITVEVEANEVGYAELLAAASAEFEKANRLIDPRPVGGAGLITSHPAPLAPRRPARRTVGFSNESDPKP